MPLCRLDFVEMMEVLDKRLNDKGKLWRHVYKVRLSLLLIYPPLAVRSTQPRCVLSRLAFTAFYNLLARARDY